MNINSNITNIEENKNIFKTSKSYLLNRKKIFKTIYLAIRWHSNHQPFDDLWTGCAYHDKRPWHILATEYHQAYVE